jgi:hypothetical protein
LFISVLVLGAVKVGGAAASSPPSGGKVGTSARSGRDRRHKDSFDEPDNKPGKEYAVVTAEEMPEGITPLPYPAQLLNDSDEYTKDLMILLNIHV